MASKAPAEIRVAVTFDCAPNRLNRKKSKLNLVPLIQKLLIVGSTIGALVLVLCVYLAPFVISESKLKDGHRGLDILGIPEIYQSDWYRKDKLWVRKIFIWSHFASLGCMAMLYFFVNFK